MDEKYHKLLISGEFLHDELTAEKTKIFFTLSLAQIGIILNKKINHSFLEEKMSKVKTGFSKMICNNSSALSRLYEWPSKICFDLIRLWKIFMPWLISDKSLKHCIHYSDYMIKFNILERRQEKAHKIQEKFRAGWTIIYQKKINWRYYCKSGKYFIYTWIIFHFIARQSFGRISKSKLFS